MSEKTEYSGSMKLMTGERVRLTPEEAEALWKKCDEEKAARERDMPTEQDALNTMFRAYQRLMELGWQEAIYCPKDGSHFDAIEAGSTGIHDCNYQGEWPKGSWWIYDGDVWPSRPILFRERHEWFKPGFIKYECCKKCGIVRRADDKNSPCKGKIGVALRRHPEGWRERMSELNKLSPAALKAAMTGGTAEWGQWGSSERHVRYMEPVASRRRCLCGCGRRETHVGMANGVALVAGCELRVARWVKQSRPA